MKIMDFRNFTLDNELSYLIRRTPKTIEEELHYNPPSKHKLELEVPWDFFERTSQGKGFCFGIRV